MRQLLSAAAFATVLLAGAACGSDPFAINWATSIDTATVFSLDRPELSLPSGFNFVTRLPVKVHDAGIEGRWDFALDTQGGQLVFLPPRLLGVADSRAMITQIEGIDFEELDQAPSDTLEYTADAPVPLRTDVVYVFQTHEEFTAFGQRCVYYAKLEALDIDMIEGELTFRFDNNPVCNDRRLIPED